jgi:hypothetical protein
MEKPDARNTEQPKIFATCDNDAQSKAMVLSSFWNMSDPI